MHSATRRLADRLAAAVAVAVLAACERGEPTPAATPAAGSRPPEHRRERAPRAAPVEVGAEERAAGQALVDSVARRTVVYKTVPGPDGPTGLQLHLFEPAGRDRSRALPAVVLFFGGGWDGGEPEQFFGFCEYLASRGAVAIAPDYRTRERFGTSPFECVMDAKSAMRQVRARAGELGIDPARIAAGGGSCGGHVALCTGVIAGHDDPADDLAVSPAPNLLLLFNPVVDTTEAGYGSQKIPEGRRLELSPLQQLAPGVPPTFVVHGTEDRAVPFENIERLRVRLYELGTNCTLVPFEGRGHAFFNFHESPEDFEAVLDRLDRYLVAMGWLEGPSQAHGYARLMSWNPAATVLRGAWQARPEGGWPAAGG
jgi:acetyl esterase/lipase